ncbi:MAG: hypothetical protein IJM58_11140 [Muribaculaceae bacterium]|nr:hypothetical protein [Muribaculaceae bacterium]
MMKRLLFRTGFAVLLVFLSSIPARSSVVLNSTNFPDDAFRNALAPYAQNGVIDETTLTTLDISNKDITDLTGLGLLTGLTYLDISDNSNLVTGANITGLTALTTLKASNCNLVSLANTTGTSSVTNVTGPGLTIGANNVNIIYLDISYNPNFYSSTNLQYLTKLETLKMHHCTHFDFWGTPGNNMSSLKYVDVSYCTNMDRIYLQAAANLEVLKAAGLPKLKGFRSKSSLSSSQQYRIVLKHNITTLKWLDVSGCTQLSNIYLRYCSNMQHLRADSTKIVGFSAYAGLNDGDPTDGYIQLPTGLTTLEYLNLANCSSMTSFRAIHDTYNINCLDTLILTNNTNLGWSNDGIEAQTNMTYLDVTHCAISTAGPNYIPNFDNLKHLETLLYGENPNVGYLRITGNSNIKTLDLHNNTGLAMLALDNCGLPRNNLNINGTNCPALTGLKLNNNGYTSISEAMNNASTWGFDNVKFLYLENNNFGGGALTLTSNECNGLTGLDLSNNNFTSFAAPSLPENLTALMIGKNPNMKRLEMHHNPGIITMAADTVMSDGSGLYLLGNTGLTYMDISGTADQPNYFQRIGNNFSLANVPIDTLKASHNQFYTFRNLSVVSTRNGWEVWKNGQYGWIEYNEHYSPASDGYVYGYWPPSPAQPDSASLEQLTNLKYLDLSYCNLKDSVHLHKNRELRYLDVSHNRTIERIYEKPEHDKGWDYRNAPDDGTADKRSFPDYKKYLWLKDPNSTGLEPFTGEYNDTTGLYDLDLAYNNKLEYLDISYTGIEQTAAQHCYVANARYVWIQDLPNLKYLYADYNGMRSMGIGTKNGRFYQEGLKSLERLSVIGMRGTDNKTMKGSINFRSPDDPVSPSPCVNLHYINASYANFDSIGIYNPTVDTIIIKGNPLHYVNVQSLPLITYVDARECAFKMRGYDVETERTYPPDVDVYKNGARNGGWYNDANTNDFPNNDPNNYKVKSPFSGLRGVMAYDRPELTTLLLDNCNALTNVYAHHNPKLTKINGFDNLAYPKPEVDATFGYDLVDADSLTLVYVNDNKVFNNLDLTHNVNLKYLHAYNDSTLGTTLGGNGMDLTANKNLVSAWVSNSRLERFVNDAGQHLDTLKIWQNPELDHLDVSDNGNLRYFDLRNCMIRTLNLDNNKKLTYFDCSNRDSIWTDYEHFTFNMPGSVPTVIDDPGKNSIADLHFKSDSLRVVHADNNDLYCMDGLSTNHKLYKLTYSYNHINAIDLSGCDSLVNDNNYNCYHNVRGLIPGELSSWKTTVNNVTTEHNLYYFQLEENAGDGLNGHNTFLGIKCGQDSLLSDQTSGYERQLAADGFDPNKVLVFTTNASGPHHGSRTPASGAPMRVNVDPSEQLDPDSFYGTIAILDKYDLVRNYIEYIYDDQRPSHRNRDGGGSAFGIAWNPPGTPTVVDETAADDLGELTVVSERYFDAAGAEHSEPVSGVNIIVRQMSDGSTETVKVIK